jgi:hypothetical protein
MDRAASRSDLLTTTQLSKIAQWLIAFNLANGGDVKDILAALRAGSSFNKLARALLADPTGFRRVLDRLAIDLRATTAAERLLRVLARLMRSDNARRALAHAEEIDRGLLRRLDVLPEELRGEAILRWLSSTLEAGVVAAIYARRAERNPRFAAALVDQLCRAQSRPALFAALARAYDDMRRHRARFDADPRWRVIRSAEDIDEVGLALELCLRQDRWRNAYIRAVTEGNALLAWWRTPSCSALVEILPTLGGEGRLSQIKAFNNKAPPPADRARICAALEALGFDCEIANGAQTDLGGLPMLVEVIGILDGDGAQRAARGALRGLRGRRTRRRDVDELWFKLCGVSELRRSA